MGRVLADASSRRPSRWNDLTVRVLSALVLLPVTIFCVWVGGGWFLALVVVGAVGLSVEWAGLCGVSVLVWPGWMLPVGLAAAAICAGSGLDWQALAILAVGWLTLAIVMARLDRATAHGTSPVGVARASRAMTREGEGAPTANVPLAHALFSRHSLAFGFPYLGPAAFALAWVRADPAAGFANTLFMLAIVWGSDIGAYMIGRIIGGAKLAPAISPGKTRSGAVGGLASAALAGLGVAACLSAEYSPSHVVMVAIALGIVSQAGDLFESALKRDFGVKDSGRIIPGHGGLLDRLDALLAVAPFAALLAFTVGRGVVLWR